jgi:hypothetical protein
MKKSLCTGAIECADSPFAGYIRTLDGIIPPAPYHHSSTALRGNAYSHSPSEPALPLLRLPPLMSSTPVGPRIRKACLPCIRAKAKCSPSEHRPDQCHRCIRLNKHCVFEVVAKKPGPGPKSRSYVRVMCYTSPLNPGVPTSWSISELLAFMNFRSSSH